ncbi:MAG: hypothetical protein EXR07_10295 [Acetobacteraceae bacterium]|nr:hypothetical protein [Acetobacteraceae bacterium]
MLAELSHSPLFILYILQACTYGTAAAISWRCGHRPLTICYSVSALLHGLFTSCRLLHLG